MSFHRIYGIGNNIKEAFITSKINEIGHGVNTSFIKKTKVREIKYNNPSKLETQLFAIHNIWMLDRELTSFELDSYNKLKKYYGEEDLDEILAIYCSTFSPVTLGFKIDRKNNKNVYKFLF